MVILGLDLSLTSTGVAVLDNGELIDHGTVRTPKTGAERLDHIWGCIQAEIDVHRPSYVAVEGYSFNSRSSQAHSIGELGGVVKVGLLRQGIETYIIPPAQWRKEVLGKGNLAKDQVRVEVFKRYGLELSSNDALEAFCVAQAAYLQITGETKPKIKPVRKKKVA